MKARMPLSVEVLRGPVVESQHQVIAVVMDERAVPAMHFGNVDYLTYPRSAIKLLQALPFFETGAADAYGLEAKHICLACSSHRGEKNHLAAMEDFFKKTGVQEKQLVCGGHLSANEAMAHEEIRRNAPLTAITNNCSGKHTALIATCLHMKENPEGYEGYHHPAQARLRKVLTEVTRFDHNKAHYGIDGCGILTYALPLKHMAAGMVALFNPKESSLRRMAAQKILQAVAAEPFYLSGSDDFTTSIIQKTQGRCIIKNGAEGVFCGVIPSKGWSFALKAEDGSARAAQAATGFLLQKLGMISEAEAAELKPFLEPKIKNWKGTEVGQIRVKLPS